MTLLHWEGKSLIDVLFLLTTIFLALSVILLVAILVSRTWKTLAKRRMAKAVDQLQEDVNALIVNELQPDAAARYHLDRLQRACQRTNNQELLVEMLSDLHRNVTGSTANVIREIFLRVGLQHCCERALKQRNWMKRAMAVKTLSQMNVLELRPKIQSLVGHSNEVLRTEALLAELRIGREASLNLLSTFHYPFTPWLRMQVYHIIQHFDTRLLPPFSQWFEHSNEDVSLFAISMVRQFQQIEAVPKLTRLLQHANPKIQGLALETLGRLGGVSELTAVGDLIQSGQLDDRLLVRAIRCVGRLGSHEHVAWLVPFLTHREYAVRWEAVAALVSLGQSGAEAIRHAEQQPAVQSMAAHLHHPLLAG